STSFLLPLHAALPICCARVPTLPRAVHVGIAVGSEALGPVVPAAGLGGVHQLQRLADAIRPDPHLVEIDRHAGHVRRPARMKQRSEEHTSELQSLAYL